MHFLHQAAVENTSFKPLESDSVIHPWVAGAGATSAGEPCACAGAVCRPLGSAVITFLLIALCIDPIVKLLFCWCVSVVGRGWVF